MRHRVAIKILHPKADHREERLAELRREFYCAQTLSHESILNVYQLDRDGEIDFFTMELLEGMSLRTWVCPSDASAPNRSASLVNSQSAQARTTTRSVCRR